MSYQVIARKWRPQNFEEIVFQEHVSKTLRNSIKNSRISHAYLFSGPRGVGKTTMARILAKALNCIEGPQPVPCEKCDNCIEIKNGNSFDVIEIDGASNRGIEDIRELRENVNFAPIKSKYKIYIIDEVHMLTKEAFNALLKTLEEPPPHVIFIFATTEIHQIPDTILSRCQKFFFKKIPLEPVVQHLRHIVSREGYKISDKALYPIARAAGGSMRDAQSLLDQVISFSEKFDEKSKDIEINEEDALAILGVVPVESYITLLFYVNAFDAASAMNEVNRVVTLGIDIPRYVSGFIDIIRTIRLLRNNISVQELLGLSLEEINMLKEVATKFYDEELSIFFRIIKDLQADLRYSTNERVNLEMALLDMITIKKAPSLTSIINSLDGVTTESSNDFNGQKKALDKVKPDKNVEKSDQKVNGKMLQDEKRGLTEKQINEKWLDFINDIKDEKQYLHFILKPSKIELKENTLNIQYPGGTDHTYYSKILDKKNLSLIKEQMTARLGYTIQVTVGIPDSRETVIDNNGSGNDKVPGTDINNYPDDTIIPPPDAEMLKNPEVEEYERVDPAVEKIKNIFHGQIIQKGDK